MEALDVPCLTFVFAIACDAAGRGTYVADTDVRPLPPPQQNCIPDHCVLTCNTVNGDLLVSADGDCTPLRRHGGVALESWCKR